MLDYVVYAICVIVLIVLFLMTIIGMFIPDNESKTKQQSSIRREDTICSFSSNITEADFVELADKVSQQSNRITQVQTCNAIVHCTVVSQSGYTSWDFFVDFNDWGRITGKYWLTSENSKSPIPQWYARTLAFEISQLLK